MTKVDGSDRRTGGRTDGPCKSSRDSLPKPNKTVKSKDKERNLPNII